MNKYFERIFIWKNINNISFYYKIKQNTQQLPKNNFIVFSYKLFAKSSMFWSLILDKTSSICTIFEGSFLPFTWYPFSYFSFFLLWNIVLTYLALAWLGFISHHGLSRHSFQQIIRFIVNNCKYNNDYQFLS
jgi:hypothetical protein